ncbi:hypothetical protein AYR54_04395 [Loigolactobacillus backii]|uniref:hypothetical protein n=1 Tax=Loigolactobacillus backii TaxID=375175 RepID=UPI0007F05839|nr:hypothetical protein [Loigolactobacillus backii]ANK59551.1 hypothetical protein AYR52_04385 [Loigolactobacillus backii]ANK64545.1 hypothetical protein AYR54_04395 [Loigolactobacillus backii]ANK67059.1 hypothetical protein AYR55_04640 [Loigolactobacillus backii]PIO87704.1 hypothetical protein B8A32_11400 [Loigolactobacillus backii]
MKKIVEVMLLILGGFLLIVCPTDSLASQPELILKQPQQALVVGETADFKLDVTGATEKDQVKITLPEGVQFDLARVVDEKTDYEVNQAKPQQITLTLTKIGATQTINLPVKLQTAGDYQMTAQFANGQAASNPLAFTVAAPANTESSSSLPSVSEVASSSSITSEAASSSSDSSTVISGSVANNEGKSSEAASDEAASDEATNSSAAANNSSSSSAITTKSPAKQTVKESDSGKSARASFTVKVDQQVLSGGLSDIYYYENSTGVTLTGNITDSIKETLIMSYIPKKISGSGPNPPGNAVSQPLGTIGTTGNNVKTPFSITIPAAKLAPFASGLGSIYGLRFDVSTGKGDTISNNFRLIYVKGTLNLVAPSQIDFGTMSADFATKPTIMGKITDSTQKLAVEDTRTIPTGVQLTGWEVTASLVKQMTSTTSSSTLTNSLHYLAGGTDYTLSSAASPVYNLAASTPGKTTSISGGWNGTTGLAFEPQPGQPKTGEKYSGTVNWNLQETPANK